MRCEGATLGDESNGSLTGEVGHGGEVEFEGRSADTHAVGADEVELVTSGDGFDFFFCRLPVGSHFSVSRCDEYDVLDTGLGTLIKYFGDGSFGYDDGGDIGGGAVEDAGVGFVAMDRVGFRVDWVDLSFVATGADVEGDEGTHFGDVGGRADDGDGFGVE